jgi:hypothetical protein
MITQFIIILFFSSIVINFDNKIQAQSNVQVYLPPVDSLLSILQKSDSISIEAEKAEFKHSYRWSMWYVAPGLYYDLVDLHPGITINASGLISYFTNKRTVERKIIAIEQKGNIKHQNNKIKLSTSYNTLKNNIIQLDMILETYHNYEKLYAIKQTQNINNEINTETFLRETIFFSERKKAVISQIDNINALMFEIESLVNCKLFYPINYVLLL